MITDTEAIVLRQVRTVNSRRMLVLFSKKFGKISVGSNLNEGGKNKTALAQRPFTYGRYELFKSRENYNLNNGQVLKSYYSIGEDLDKYMAASYVLELTEKVVSIKRVTKVVKGGRNMRFTALVVVGDGNGHVGVGLGKSIEIPEAIRKGKEDAMKSLISVPIDQNDSIPYDIIGKFGSAEVLLKRAPEGTGIIAGGPARSILELAGIKNIRTKSLGSNNKQNVVLATIEGLKSMKTPEEVARLRGKSVSEILG